MLLHATLPKVNYTDILTGRLIEKVRCLTEKYELERKTGIEIDWFHELDEVAEAYKKLEQRIELSIQKRKGKK